MYNSNFYSAIALFPLRYYHHSDDAGLTYLDYCLFTFVEMIDLRSSTISSTAIFSCIDGSETIATPQYKYIKPIGISHFQGVCMQFRLYLYLRYGIK